MTDQDVQKAAGEYVRFLVESVPEGFGQTQAISKIQESIWWANKALWDKNHEAAKTEVKPA